MLNLSFLRVFADFYVSKKKKNKPKEYKQAPEGSDDKDDEETRIFEHMTVVSIPRKTYHKYAREYFQI